MKKLFILFAVISTICACAGVSSYDGDSTREWVYIESSKQDLEGKTIDVCYRFDVRFSPQEATERFDTDKACMTKCCWYSDTKKIILNLNMDFAKELAQQGQANKYTADTLTFTVRYSNFLNTLHASVTPSSVMRSDGLINLDYTLVRDDKGLLKIDLGDLKVKDYSQEEDAHKGSYLYKEQEKAMREYQENLEHLKEMSEYQRVDTGRTETKEALPQTKETVIEEEQIVLSTPKTVIGTLQTQEAKQQIQIKQEVKEVQTSSVKDLQKPQNTEQENVFYTTEVYNLNDPAQRQELLERKLAYERSQAVSLLKQFYEQDIDEYVRFVDKQQASKGYVLLANDRQWKTTKIGYPIYRVNCSVKGKLGKTKNNMKAYPLPCGIYEVDLDEKTVLPRDITAITIVNKDYKY